MSGYLFLLVKSFPAGLFLPFDTASAERTEEQICEFLIRPLDAKKVPTNNGRSRRDDARETNTRGKHRQQRLTRYVSRGQSKKFLIQPLDAKKNLTNNKNNTRRRHDQRLQDQGRNPTRKSVPPRARKRSESGRVREGQNS